MPGDGFAFAIRVCRQDQLVGVFDRFRDFADDFLGLGVNVPVHHKVVIRFHRPIFGGQVANVAVGGNYLIARAKVFIDGLGLGGGLDDDDVHLALLLLGAHSPPRLIPGAVVHPALTGGPGTWLIAASLSNGQNTIYGRSKV